MPASLKEKNQLLQAVQIFLGRIDDADETYFNGRKVGSAIGWDVDRFYLILFGIIQWDKENVIAIRLENTGGNGGMYGGIHAIGDVQLTDVVSVSSKHKPVAFINVGTKLAYTLVFTLKVFVDCIKGILKTKVYNPLNNEMVYEKSEDFVVGNKADSSYPFAVKLKTPAAYKIDYSFTATALTGAINPTSLFFYTSIPWSSTTGNIL